MSDVIDKIREKYPQYKSVSDDELVEKVGQKYPQYLDRDPVFKADFDRITKAATTRAETSPAHTEDSDFGQPIRPTPVASPPHAEESDYVPEVVKPPEGPGTSLYPIGEGATIPGAEPKAPEPQTPLIPPGTLPSVTPPTAEQEAAAGQRMEKLTAPIVPLPRIEGTNPNVLAFLSGAMGRPVTERESQAIAALYNTGKGFAEFFESPLGISTMGTAGVAPSILKRLVSGLFAADIAKNTPEAARKAGEASVTGTPQEQLEAGLSLASTILLPSALGKHALGEPIAAATGAAPSVEGARIRVPFGAQKDLAMLADRMSVVAPATAAATKSVAELSIPTQLEQFKKAASEELPKPPDQVEGTASYGGYNYVKRGGRWYAEGAELPLREGDAAASASKTDRDAARFISELERRITTETASEEQPKELRLSGPVKEAPIAKTPIEETMWSSSDPSIGKSTYFSSRKEDAEAYSLGRPVKQYLVSVKNPFDPQHSDNPELVSMFDKLGGIQEAPRNPRFIKAAKAAGFDSVVGGESGYGGTSKWIVVFDKSSVRPSETPTVTETTPKVPEAEIPKTPTQTGFRPAIRLVGGEVVVGDAGKTHPDIIAERGLKAEDIDQRGFVNEKGEFKDREQTAQETGLPTQREEQRQHSTDLPEAQQPPVEKGPDAIHGEAAPILRPVREEPSKGVREMPVEEGRKPDDEGRGKETPQPEPSPKQDVTIKGSVKGATPEQIADAVTMAISEGGMVQGIKEGADKSGHYVVIPPDPEIEGDTAQAIGPFISKEAAAEFLDAEVGAPGAKVIEAGIKPRLIQSEPLSKQDEISRISGLTAQQFRDEFKPGAKVGAQVSAQALGDKLRGNPEAVARLKEAKATAEADYRFAAEQAANVPTEAKLNDAQTHAQKVQYFSEAITRAELTEAPKPETLPVAAPETITEGTAKGIPERTGSLISAEAGKTARSAAPRQTRAEKERPWDLIDHIESSLGGKISLKKARELIEDFKPIGAARKLFAQEGFAPDVAAQAALDFKDYGSDVAFLEALNETGRARKTWRERFYKQEKGIKEEEAQHKAFTRDAKHPGPASDVIVPEDLFVGDELTVAGTKLKVKSFEFDENGDIASVELEDGSKYGTQQVAAGTKLFIDERSLKQKEPSTEFAPSEPIPEPPKLRPGEKVGEMFQGEDQPFNLAGEKGTDAERIAAEKAKAEQAKKEADELAAKQQTQLVGMGGAVKSEFEPSGGTPTSTKNAKVDDERVKRGLPPAMQPARKAFGEVWDRAMAMVDHDPGIQDVLIKELRDHPRAIKDEENALLLHRQIDLQNEYGKATRDLAQAYDDGRTEDVVREKLRVANISDKLLDLYDINKRVGTETGRGLASRKMMANEDFTLASLELQKRSANGGRALTDTERANLQKIADEWKSKAEAYERAIATKDQRIADMAANAALEKVAREAAPEAKIHPKIIQIAERIVKELDTKADAARARIRARMGRTMAGVDPTVLLDLAEIGASHLGHKILDFAKWSEKMIEDVGDWVKPHLKEVYDKSQATIDTLADKAGKAQVGAVKRALKGESIEDTKKAVSEAVAEHAGKGEKSKITWQVQKLARALYRSGITEREAMVDALHEVLKEAIPDITRRETADAFSGYGDFKQLKKDQMSVDLRGMKGELQQLAKLEDMAAGKPPLKTGVERRTQTEAERKLIKEVNDAKNKFQVPVEDPETQLKSSLDTLKTTLRNRITDLEDRMARKDYAPRPRRELTLDAEAARLKAARDRVSKKWQEELTADRLKNRTPWEKIMDWTTKLRRFDVLSSPVVIPKLLSAGLARITTMPTEDIIGGALSKVPGISEVAKRAPLEGAGLNLKAELRGFKPAFMQGLKDAYSVLKTGHSDLDVLYGKASESYTGEFEYGARLLSFPGRLHGMIKAPVKRIAFERAVDRLKVFYAKEGADLSNDATKMKIGVEAYKAANRSIFLQDNKVASAFTAATRTLEASKRGEAPSAAGKAGATAARVVFPIVRVPTNIVAETFQYIAGTVTGSARLARAFSKGIENIKPEEADLIMRELKKGSLGAAVMLIGYFNPEAIGGYYQPGKKRDPSDVKAGSIRVYGHDIPSYLLHNPLLETLQFGATIRRVSDSYLKKKDTQQQGVTAGVWAATLGLTEEVPFVREMIEYEKLRNPYTRGQFMGAQAKSLVVPAVVQKAAEWTDRDEYGNLIQRKPGTVPEAIKSGIPGLRQTVPVK